MSSMVMRAGRQGREVPFVSGSRDGTSQNSQSSEKYPATRRKTSRKRLGSIRLPLCFLLSATLLQVILYHPVGLVGFRRKLPKDNPFLLTLQRSARSPEEIEKLNIVETWQQMTDLYGPMDEPVILGMETCEAYRRAVNHTRRYVATAGLLNTGTNAMSFNLQSNLNMAAAWQVPWAKHNVPSQRLNFTAPGSEKLIQEDALPIVIIRDPFNWMQSLCKSPYAFKWKRSPMHCPNLVPTADDRMRFTLEANDTFRVRGIYNKPPWFYWDSLVHLWNDWYRQYLEADYPRLIVRFEDTLLHTPAIMQKIAECAGGTVPEGFTYKISTSKMHGSGTDFVQAIVKTGDKHRRVKKLTTDDLAFAAKHLDSELMSIFHYSLPEIAVSVNHTVTLAST